MRSKNPSGDLGHLQGSPGGSHYGSEQGSQQGADDGPLPYLDTLDYLNDKFALISVMIQQEEARYGTLHANRLCVDPLLT